MITTLTTPRRWYWRATRLRCHQMPFSTAAAESTAPTVVATWAAAVMRLWLMGGVPACGRRAARRRATKRSMLASSVSSRTCRHQVWQVEEGS